MAVGSLAPKQPFSRTEYYWWQTGWAIGWVDLAPVSVLFVKTYPFGPGFDSPVSEAIGAWSTQRRPALASALWRRLARESGENRDLAWFLQKRRRHRAWVSASGVRWLAMALTWC